MALPNLIYFTRSHGCPYCDKFAPVMDSFITKSFPLEILKLDTCDDENKALAKLLGCTVVPSIVEVNREDCTYRIHEDISSWSEEQLNEIFLSGYKEEPQDEDGASDIMETNS